ncbi:MAG: PIG-L deacetylase family protein [Acidimicrobiales bacterium]
MKTPRYHRDPRIARALVVMAHPDDVDFGAGGTVARLVRDGVSVAYCLVTSGDAGGDSSRATPEERAITREAEQRAAAAALGVSDLTFLRWPDGRVEVTLELRAALARVIRTQRPDLVICQSPERNFDRIYASHPDHLAAGEATLRAIYPDARNPHAFPELLAEGLAPHVVGQVWLSTSVGANLVVDITRTFDDKIAALRCHGSQVGDRRGLRKSLRASARATAAWARLGGQRLAESFRVIVTG